MAVLVTGGAGYIGSHVVKQLLEYTKDEIVVIDNISAGHLATIETLQNIRSFKFFKEELSNTKKINDILKENKIDTILHFAASIVVSESVSDPLKYYINNTTNTINLINIALKNNIKKFIFSSTAAVYGESNVIDLSRIKEDDERNPINPYGNSKYMVEQVIKDSAEVNKDFKYVIFRYFNVAGADIRYIDNLISPRVGEMHDPETHLIPLVVKTALGKRESIKVFGDDYNTPDGTCIRDYIHVDDLADAHIKAISYLDTNLSDIFNVGYGRGYSVKEVLKTVKKVTQKEFKVDIEPRREGDSSILVANSDKLKEKMNWKPKYDNLELICESAYRWEQKL